MNQKTKHFLAVFALSLILILALSGFLAVDLTAERDMGGEYEPLFRLSAITSHGMEISLLGKHYYFLPELLTPAKEVIWKLRGLLPDSAQAAALLFVRGYEAMEE
jgi:hypothetical protein